MITVGLSGCGAATRIYHRPALSVLEGEGAIRVLTAYDPDPAASRSLCESFATASAAPSFEAMIGRGPDLVIIASPPDRHPSQVLAALAAGTSVLCEKPLAISMAEAEAMAASVRTSSGVLTVGMVRRQLGAARLVSAMIRSQALGRLQSIEIFEGGPFEWPVHSPKYFQPRAGGVGVLEDIGTHVVDLLRWWLGEPEVVAYADDAMGGVAANAHLELAFGRCSVTVRLSRDWRRPNGYRIRGDAGWIDWPELDPERVDFGLTGPGVGARAAACELASTSGLAQPSGGFEEAFVRQLRGTLDAVAGRPAEVVTVEEALGTVKIIERCRAVRETMEMPWLS